MSEVDAVFGERLRALRQAHGQSQGAVADRMAQLGHGWTQSTMSKVEHGQRSVTLAEASALAAILGADLPAMISREPAPGGHAYAVAAARVIALHEAVNAVAELRNQAEAAANQLLAAGTDQPKRRPAKTRKEGSRKQT